MGGSGAGFERSHLRNQNASCALQYAGQENHLGTVMDVFILIVGFLLGYGVREIISRRRHAAARRYGRLLHPNLTSDELATSIPARDQLAL